MYNHTYTNPRYNHTSCRDMASGGLAHVGDRFPRIMAMSNKWESIEEK